MLVLGGLAGSTIFDSSDAPDTRTLAAEVGQGHAWVETADGRSLDAKAQHWLRPGERVVLHTPGGGGYGDARQRDPALIAEDLLQGLYDEETTRALYPDQAAEAFRVRDELLTVLRRRSEA
jgi:N-methylhydantoinase B